MDITKKGYYFIAIIVTLYVWVTILFFLNPIGGVEDYFIRLAVLYGFTSLFLTSIITPFMKEVYQMFGTSFIKIHHLFSILGLVLITIHPIAFAISIGDPTAFIPIFYPWNTFWALAGRPALYLIYIAVIAVLIRKHLNPKLWRILHGLNYVAFYFAYIHGAVIGDDFESLLGMITFTAMIVIVFEVLFYRRYQKYKLKQMKKNE
ncbi:MAG: ferric reductase-like transmembrane domain-containing protein [Promethearchaeia archaeon]